jgi:hypothetical protein
VLGYYCRVFWVGEGKTIPVQAYYRSIKFQEAEPPRFLDNRHMKVVRLPALSTGQFYPEEIILVISVRGRVEPKVIVRQEGLSQ